MNPKTSSEVFTINVKSLADQRLISLTTVEKPVTPPNAK